MLYAIMAEDVPGTLDKRLQVRPDHVARLTALSDDGRLIVAGPFPAVDCEDPGAAGFTGSLIVAEFETLEDARSWADADPYVVAGVYGDVTIKPFKKVFG